MLVSNRSSTIIHRIMSRNLPLLFAVLIVSSCELSAQTADIIMTNGKVFTADARQLYVQALAIKDNKVLAIGTDSEIVRMASAGTNRIDLGGRTVVPGFNDAHDHPGWLAPVD